MKALRKRTGLSQIEVAEKLGKDQSAIARWESGKAEPRLSELLALAELYQCSLGHLVDNGDGLTDEERAFIAFIRANPVHRKLFLGQMEVLREDARDAATG